MAECCCLTPDSSNTELKLELLCGHNCQECTKPCLQNACCMRFLSCQVLNRMTAQPSILEATVAMDVYHPPKHSTATVSCSADGTPIKLLAQQSQQAASRTTEGYVIWTVDLKNSKTSFSSSSLDELLFVLICPFKLGKLTCMTTALVSIF